MHGAMRWHTFKVCLCLLAISAYLARSARADLAVADGATTGGGTVHSQEIRQFLANDAIVEILATLDYTPQRVLALMEGREEAELERLSVCLGEVSPRRALARRLTGEGYSERQAVDVVASLTDDEIDEVVAYDSARGGYVYIPAMAIAVAAVVGAIVLVLIALIMEDQARQKKAAEHKARLLSEERDSRELATELEQLKSELERLRQERGANEPLPPPPRF